jgi:hypothetical protein
MRERTATINQIKAMLVAAPKPAGPIPGLSNSKLTTAWTSSRPPAQP